jgi:hypothetical protein
VLTVTSSQPLTLSPVVVRDNSLGGYYQYGTWSLAAKGYLGTESVANPATSSAASSEWLFSVPAGTYDIWGTWVSAASDATNTSYTVYDGFSKLGTAQENQQLAPSGGQYGGVLWTMLGTYTVTNGRVTVVMSASGANGDVVADGMLLTASTAAAAAIKTISVPAAANSVSVRALGPLMPATVSGPVRGATAAPVQISTSINTAASPVPITVRYADSSSPEQAANLDEGKTARLTSRAHRSVRTSHHAKAHESLIARLAREQLSAKKQSAILRIRR